MKSATNTTKMKGTMVRAEPKTIDTVDIDTSALLPWQWHTRCFIRTVSPPADL